MTVSSKIIDGLTRQRKAVYHVISNSEEHLTASQVFELAKSELPTISFATVYNSLRYLKEEGLIGEVSFANRAARYDRFTSRHDHAICVDCGKLADLELQIPNSLYKEAVEASGFRSGSIEITLRGHCSNCV